ncbi:MAG: hypothetical protein LN413_03325 [Candidatus Thermoplasmatota archaeon]|nr:hypothetical protein [Candidatus Thermoplasmatota archaeon]
MGAEKATGAFVLGLVGAIFHLIGGLVFIFVGTLFLGFAGIPGTGAGTPEMFAGIGLVLIALPVIFIVLAFLGAFWMYSGDKRRTTYGGVLTLIISIVAFATLWGLFLGSLLGFIGAILALVWNPTPAMPAPALAATPPPAMPAPAPAATPPPAAPAPEPTVPEPEEPSTEPEEQ